MKQTLLKAVAMLALAGVTAISMTGCATSGDKLTAPPSATVKISEWSAAYYGSATTGKGTLTFQGQDYPFTISGLGAGGMGGQKINATGKVYNLNSLSDFNGSYRGASGGLTLIEGKMHAKLSNSNGVNMYIAGTTEGLASSIGVQVFEVKLK